MKHILTLSIIAFLLSSSYSQENASSRYFDDTKSIDNICKASLEVISVPLGDSVNWERNDNLYLPSATLTVVAWTDSSYRSFTFTLESFKKIAGYGKKFGFMEVEVSKEIHQYGPIANVFQTYEARVEGQYEVKKGINAYQLVKKDGRWWIAGMTYFEEDSNHPIPKEFLPNE